MPFLHKSFLISLKYEKYCNCVECFVVSLSVYLCFSVLFLFLPFNPPFAASSISLLFSSHCSMFSLSPSSHHQLVYQPRHIFYYRYQSRFIAIVFATSIFHPQSIRWVTVEKLHQTRNLGVLKIEKQKGDIFSNLVDLQN